MRAADIDPETTNQLSEGETLDGEGATIKVEQHDDDGDNDDVTYHRPLIEVPDGCTVKNLVLQGPFYDIVKGGNWWDYEVSGEAWETAASAIKVVGSNVEIENVTCSGWSFGGVIVGDLGGDYHEDVYVRDCDLIDNNCRALGYGVAVYSGNPVVEWCEFLNNRHAIATGGRPNAGYEARFNHVGEVGRIYGFEAHGPQSDRIHVHHNTFEDMRGNTPRKGRGRRILIRNRGVPVKECVVENNWFKGAMTVLMSDEAREWYTFRDNHEGPSEPPEGIGQPDRSDGDEDESDPDQDDDHDCDPRLARQLCEVGAALTDLRDALNRI